MYSIFGALNIKYEVQVNIGPTQSVLRTFARNFVQTCLGEPESGSFRFTIIYFSPYGKRLTIIDFFEDL